jgi:hypothetical protein
MSLCGDGEEDRLVGGSRPHPSREDEAHVDYVMANMTREGV